MNKLMWISFLVAMLPCCDEKKQEQPVPPPAVSEGANLAALNLSDADPSFAGLSIRAPEGARAEKGDGFIRVRTGEKFNLVLRALGSKTLEAARNDFSSERELSQDAKGSLGIPGVKNYHRGEPNLFVRETEDGNLEFGCLVEAGGKFYLCYDWNDLGKIRFSQADVDLMIQACRSLRQQ